MSDYQYVEEGSLPPPGKIGRLTRLALGLGCLYLVSQLVSAGWWRVDEQHLTGVSLWPWIIFAVFLFPEVFNLGFSLSISRRGLRIGAVIIGVVVATASKAASGSFLGGPFGVLVFLWLLYVYGHLGLSLVLAAILRTPGCEMRAIPHLWTLLTGRSSREHFCPGVFDPLDRWERERGKEETSGKQP